MFFDIHIDLIILKTFYFNNQNIIAYHQITVIGKMLCSSADVIHSKCIIITYQTRMWANAQHDGHPDEYRWRPLLNVAKFG